MIPTVAVLAGGLASRLHPVTERIPKLLVPVKGEPFGFHLLRLLARNRFERVCLLVGHKGQDIVTALGDGSRFGLHLSYVFDGPVLLGTGGAIAHALPELGDEFGVIYGDSWLDFDYDSAMRRFHADARPALMTVYRNAGKWDTSNVQFADGEILAYCKSAPTHQMTHIDYGFGLFRKRVFADVPIDRPTDLAEIYARLASTGQLAALEVDVRFYEIGSHAGLADFEVHLSGGRK